LAKIVSLASNLNNRLANTSGLEKHTTTCISNLCRSGSITINVYASFLIAPLNLLLSFIKILRIKASLKPVITSPISHYYKFIWSPFILSILLNYSHINTFSYSRISYISIKIDEYISIYIQRLSWPIRYYTGLLRIRILKRAIKTLNS
jgi:hypothetical protein